MKTGLSLQALAVELTRQRDSKKDFLADTRAVAMSEDATRITMPDSGSNLPFDYPIQAFAHKQLAGKLDIPVGFYQRIQERQPDLLAHMVNGLFQREPQKTMLRTLDGQVRAVVSNSFRTLDNCDLAEAVLPVLLERGATVESCQITETKLYIKAVLPALTRELPVQEGLKMGQGHTLFLRRIMAGITISNSEVGAGSLAIQPGIYERQCTNMATFSDSNFRRTHVGRKQEIGDDGIMEFLSDDTKRLADAVVWAKVRDLTQASFDGQIFENLCQKMILARGDEITVAVPAVVEVLAKQERFTDKERGGFLEHLMRGGEFTRYGLQWAATRLAQDAEDYERASELERLGGKIIELPRADWQEILKKAA